MAVTVTFDPVEGPYVLQNGAPPFTFHFNITAGMWGSPVYDGSSCYLHLQVTGGAWDSVHW